MHDETGWVRSEPPAPVRVVHLGLGAFARAHQLWYTHQANERVDPADRWGVAAFTGRSPVAAQALATQDGRYTVLVRSADGDTPTVVDSLVSVHDGTDGTAWRGHLSRAEVGVVTLTVTEAGYRRLPSGGLDRDHPGVARDIARHARDAETAPGRLVDGLRARRAAGAGPIAVVSCDNLPDNGDATRRVTLELARQVDAGLARWIEENVSFVSTMVDRITPATTDADRAAVRTLTGRDDRSPVVTEPFSDWVLQGGFPAGRPAWELAGARFVDDLAPEVHRKLWLLNAGHSLLAYEGLARGRSTVAEAFADPVCRADLERLWSEAAEVLPVPVDGPVADLRTRFANARIEHRLDQIARDGSQKLPVRVLAVAQARSAAGLPVGRAGAAVVAAWIQHLEATDVSASDPGATALAERLPGRGSAARARLALDLLAPRLARSDVFARHVAESLAVRQPTLTGARP
ncbi:mannitol dehydrogenase [Cellulomonas chitinilytica]|uniref:Mannitol-1-phosphate 5-dehydrogenase n=1 Tax=Cellulomonas chitinilytica TaxID=398759 RepID=A0A919TYC1_9CELL|nr:mannitol dehydrogenase family protein [Cellulomonas chitinilytica]GIG20435.1 mannitol dehydrogenase [Cellulomonas chitinilytica]